MEISELIHTLWPKGDGPANPQAYALLDGARHHSIAPEIRQSNLPSTCLFSGPLTPALEQAAPHLVQLAPQSRFFKKTFDRGWGDAWGTYLVARPDTTLQALRRHLKKWLRIQSPDGKVLAFRFYDPRVLQGFLPSCTQDEAARFFGPMTRIVYESSPLGVMKCVSLAEGPWSPPVPEEAVARRPFASSSTTPLFGLRTAQMEALRCHMRHAWLERQLRSCEPADGLRMEQKAATDLAQSALDQASRFWFITEDGKSAFVRHCLRQKVLFSAELQRLWSLQKDEHLRDTEAQRLAWLVSLQAQGTGFTPPEPCPTTQSAGPNMMSQTGIAMLESANAN